MPDGYTVANRRFFCNDRAWNGGFKVNYPTDFDQCWRLPEFEGNLPVLSTFSNLMGYLVGRHDGGPDVIFFQR